MEVCVTCFGRVSSSISSSSLMPFRRSLSLVCFCCELFLAVSTSALQHMSSHQYKAQTPVARRDDAGPC